MSSINPNFFDLDAPATESPVPTQITETLLDLNSGAADQSAAPGNTFNVLDITDKQGAEAAKRVGGPGIAEIGRIASGFSNAVQVGRANGTI